MKTEQQIRERLKQIDESMQKATTRYKNKLTIARDILKWVLDEFDNVVK